MSRFVIVYDENGIELALKASEILSMQLEAGNEPTEEDDILWVTKIKTVSGINYYSSDILMTEYNAMIDFHRILDVLNEKQ